MHASGEFVDLVNYLILSVVGFFSFLFQCSMLGCIFCCYIYTIFTVKVTMLSHIGY